jgi:hypothetical protein
MEEVDASAMMAELVRVTRPGGRIGVIVRATDLPFHSNFPLRAELKAKFEAPRPGGAVPLGCGTADLYRRFRQAGLQDVRMMPDLTVFDDFAGTVEQSMMVDLLAQFTTVEVAEWHHAAAQAVAEGTFYLTWPHHCAVGTKPG